MTTIIKTLCSATPIFTTMLFVYITKDWMVLYLIVIFMTLLVLLISFLLPESPKFLVNQGRYDEAKAVIDQICYFNKRNIFLWKLP